MSFKGPFKPEVFSDSLNHRHRTATLNPASLTSPSHPASLPQILYPTSDFSLWRPSCSIPWCPISLAAFQAPKSKYLQPLIGTGGLMGVSGALRTWQERFPSGGEQLCWRLAGSFSCGRLCWFCIALNEIRLKRD